MNKLYYLSLTDEYTNRVHWAVRIGDAWFAAEHCPTSAGYVTKEEAEEWLKRLPVAFWECYTLGIEHIDPDREYIGPWRR